MTGTWEFDVGDAATVAPAGPGVIVLGPFTATRIPVAVPTLTQWGLGLLLGLLAVGGSLLIGRSII